MDKKEFLEVIQIYDIRVFGDFKKGTEEWKEALWFFNDGKYNYISKGKSSDYVEIEKSELDDFLNFENIEKYILEERL